MSNLVDRWEVMNVDVKYYYEDNLIFETHTDDLSGLIMAIEKNKWNLFP